MGIIIISHAWPGPSLQYISIGDWKNDKIWVFISGRRLICNENAANKTTNCSMNILGKLLEIQVHGNRPTVDFPDETSTCKAFYEEKDWECRIGYGRGTGVTWVAFIDSALGFALSDIEQLKQKYFFENLSEDTYMNAVGVIAILTMIVSILVTLLLCYAYGKNIFITAGSTIVIGIASFFGALWIAASWTEVFWD